MGQMQLALVARARPHQGEEHPPTALMLDQRSIGHGQIAEQGTFALPVVQAVVAAVERHLTGLGALGHHESGTFMLKDLGVGQMKRPGQHGTPAAPLQIGRAQLVALDHGVLGPVVEGLDEDMQGVTTTQAKGIGQIAPGPGRRQPGDGTGQGLQTGGVERLNRCRHDADLPEIGARPLKHGPRRSADAAAFAAPWHAG